MLLRKVKSTILILIEDTHCMCNTNPVLTADPLDHSKDIPKMCTIRIIGAVPNDSILHSHHIISYTTPVDQVLLCLSCSTRFCQELMVPPCSHCSENSFLLLCNHFLFSWWPLWWYHR